MDILKDPYGRSIDSLRVLVTSRCNYKCIYCHSEGVFYKPIEVFNSDDYGFIAKTARRLGIRFYKISGGEPLIRHDIVDIVKSIRPYADEISLVTNGSLLLENVVGLAEAGLDRVNVSLHSLSEQVYSHITGGSRLLWRVINGIREALDHGIRVKLNFLVLKSNIGEFLKILEFAELNGLDINVIELIPLGVPREIYESEHVSLGNLIEYLEKNHVSKYHRELQSRPIYVLGSGIRVEVVIGYGNYLFCDKCSRIRLTPDGYLKPCLYVEYPRLDVVDVVKSRDEEGLLNALRELVSLRKPYFTK